MQVTWLRQPPGLRARRTGSDGFSLVEVLVAMGLLVTAVVSLVQLFALATRANAVAGEMTEATVLAAQKIEELRAAPFPGVLGRQSVDYLDSRGDRLGAAAGRRAYVRRWWIESHRVDAAATTVAITVVVSRYQLGGRGVSSAGGQAGETPAAGPAVGPAPQELARLVTLRTRWVP